jgi:branched-chain amino acid transport system ATP-binding protein
MISTGSENKSMNHESLLRVQNLVKKFGDLAAVNGLSFSVQEGAIFGIAGPNGSGKTTLFNVITGKLHGSGEIFFSGTDIHGLRPYQICQQGIARTFQIPITFKNLTLYDNVRVGAHFGADGRAENENVRECIDFVGLSGKENDTPKNLSLLNKKMTMLAIALATQPKLLLLDEIIAGLAPAEIEPTMELIRRVNVERGITIIIIEHLMQVLMGLCQQMMILNNGDNIKIGTPDEVAHDQQVRDIYLGEEYA